ncbi:fimbrial protein [Bacteroides sp.]|uniref:fimbrial tip adhesin FimD n=1 Tax=Bacteroides sp. TaxID=29523 RepID=UPI002583D306|nr:fimbrial protein [Bacteroides sp.]
MKKKNSLFYGMLVGLAALSFSCTEADDFNQEAPAGKALKLELDAPGIVTKVEAENGVDELNENAIVDAQLLVFNEDGNRCGYRKLNFSDGGTVAVVATGDWKNDTDLFDKGADAAYTLYVVANAHGENGGSLEGVKTLLDLQNAVDEDGDIWKFEKANVNGETYQYKKFAMAGKSSVFTPSTCEDECTVTIPVQRLAAKVEVNIKFDDGFALKFVPTGYYSSLRNYATRGLWLADREAQLRDRGLAGNESNDQMAAAWKKNEEEKTATLLLYTYPNDWGNDVLSETFVLLNMPGQYTDEAEQELLKQDNYYKIPIRLGGTEAYKLNRNTIYRVNVTIDRLGQEKPDVPVELKPEYEVLPWETVTIDVDDSNINYLELQKDQIIMKNIEKSGEQFFTSSSSVTATITEVYYYDKYGEKQTIGEGSYGRYGISVSCDGGREGNITVNSKNPANNGIRYIKIEVTNAQGMSKVFTVKQYPLEYIVTVPGWYSYRDDNICDNRVVHWESGTFDKNFDKPTTSANNFSSKVYDENEPGIRTYSYTRDSEWVGGIFGHWEYSDWYVKASNNLESNSNNKMYFVRITKTSNEYVLSVPAIDKDGYTDGSANNNKLVAPAFMIASQLGTVSQQQFSSAKEHCKQYAEKSLAGVVYNDWRLPTEEEIKIIDKYQGTENSVIDIVLGGKYYWAASGKRVEAIHGSNYPDRNYAFIRCIRTVKPDEPIVEDKE